MRDSANRWFVLEDNLRVPSGLGYAMISRRLVRSVLPDLEPASGVVPVEGVPELLRTTLLASNSDGDGDDTIALLSAGPLDAAYYEHRLLAEQMAVPLVTPGELTVTDNGVYAHGQRLDVLYRRLDEQTLPDATGADGKPLGSAICTAVADGRVSLLNTLGNGVADDKRVYSYVPDMITYYLGEQALLENVPTYPCADPRHLAEVLDRLDELVLKPVNGYGGHGIVIGPDADRAQLAELAETIRANPADWVAQDCEDLTYWQPSFSRGDPGLPTAEWPGAVLDALRLAVQRRMVADVPVGILLSGGIDSSLVVALLAEGGQHGLRTFSVGFEAAGGESGDEFVYSDQVAAHFGTDHQKIMVGSARLLPAVDAAIDAMSEPMVSHDCVAFYLLSQEVSRSVTVVQSEQGAGEVFAGYDWYPPLAGVPREAAAGAYAEVFVDRPHVELADLLEPEWLAGDGFFTTDHSQAFIERHFDAAGADTALDAALRLDTTVILADDPVKRVDNMTMAWGVEARVPFLGHELVELAGACPPELKLAAGGKGVLKAASRGVVPDPIIDRPKGYFPVPAIRHLSGSFLDRVRDAVTDPVAKDRGLFRPGWLERMLADPNTARTTLGSNALWQVALLEMWLQQRGI